MKSFELNQLFDFYIIFKIMSHVRYSILIIDNINWAMNYYLLYSAILTYTNCSIIFFLFNNIEFFICLVWLPFFLLCVTSYLY